MMMMSMMLMMKLCVLHSEAKNGMFDSERREVWITCYPDRAEFRICIPFGAEQGKTSSC